MTTVTETPELRHPLDPEPVRSTKAVVVLALGAVATITGFFVGGLIPATIALVIARSAKADMVAAKGYLTGVRMLQTGTRLAWAGIILAATALVIASVIGILDVASSPSGTHFAPGTN